VIDIHGHGDATASTIFESFGEARHLFFVAEFRRGRELPPVGGRFAAFDRIQSGAGDHHGVAGAGGVRRLHITIRQDAVLAAGRAKEKRLGKRLPEESGGYVDLLYIVLQKMRANDKLIEAGAIVSKRGFVLGTFIEIIPCERVQLGLRQQLHVEYVHRGIDRIFKISVLAVCERQRRRC
jgi:hypothetical protein